MKTPLISCSCLLVIVGIYVATSETDAGTSPPRSVHTKFAPVEMPKGPGPVSLELSFIPKTWKNQLEKEDYYSKEAEIRVMAIDNLQYFGDSVWTVKVDSGVWSDMIINVIIPSNDISGIRLRIKWGRTPNDVAAYFVTTGDTIEFYPGRPSGHDPTPSPRSLKTFIDTLTEEQLQTKYEVLLELKGSSNLEFVENLVGHLADSNIIDAKRGHYRLWISLENLIKIGEKGIEFGFVDPPLWTPEGRWKRDAKNKEVRPKVSSGQKEESQAPQQELRPIPRQTAPAGLRGEWRPVPQTEADRQAILQSRYRQMHALEVAPHEGESNQHFLVGDEVWVRAPGEYKFHISEGIKDMKAWSQRQNDSITNIPPDAPHVAEMYLDDPEDYQLAKQHVDSLRKTAQGTYLGWSTRKVLRELWDAGIGYRSLRRIYQEARETTESDEHN